MKLEIAARYRTSVFAIALGLSFTSILNAQQMPQDNWRYDGLQFSAPDNTRTLGSIAIGSGGVYVEQNTNPVSIVQFEESGVFIRQFGSFGDIVGIACDSSGNVYVLDSGDRMVKVFDASGNFLRQWGGSGTGDGQFGNFMAFSLRDAMLSLGPDNQVYVADSGNQRVQVFDTTGNFLRKWGEAGSLPGQFDVQELRSIAVGPNGLVYVAGNRGSSGGGGIAVFTSQGIYVKHIADQSYHYAYSVAVTGDGLVSGFFQGNSYAFRSVNDQANAEILFQPGGTLGAYNSRGDFYSVFGTSIKVWEREYSNVSLLRFRGQQRLGKQPQARHEHNHDNQTLV